MRSHRRPVCCRIRSRCPLYCRIRSRRPVRRRRSSRRLVCRRSRRTSCHPVRRLQLSPPLRDSSAARTLLVRRRRTRPPVTLWNNCATIAGSKTRTSTGTHSTSDVCGCLREPRLPTGVRAAHISLRTAMRS